MKPVTAFVHIGRLRTISYGTRVPINWKIKKLNQKINFIVREEKLDRAHAHNELFANMQTRETVKMK